MDPKTIAFGTAVVAASIGGAALVQTKDIVAVSAGEADVAVTEIAKVEPELQDKTCTREWVTVQVAKGPELVWLCDGVYLPAQQSWLTKTAGEDGVRIELRPRLEDGKYVIDATVTNGPMPEKASVN